MTLTKEARRRDEALKKRRKQRIATGAVVGLVVAVAPLLFYAATRI